MWSDVGAGFTAKAFSRTRIGSGASDPIHKGFVMSSFPHLLSCPHLSCIEDARARANTTSRLVATTSRGKLGKPDACDKTTLSIAFVLEIDCGPASAGWTPGPSFRPCCPSSQHWSAQLVVTLSPPDGDTKSLNDGAAEDWTNSVEQEQGSIDEAHVARTVLLDVVRGLP